MRPCAIEAAGLSDAGSVRQFNEDHIAIDTRVGVVALADGMGGHRGGEVASRMATDIVVAGLRAHFDSARASRTQPSPRPAVEQSIKQANRAILQAAGTDASRAGMGTTLAMAAFHGGSVVLGHVGDSRIYRLRDGRLALLTRDDSLLRDEVDLGVITPAQAAQSHNRSLVTQALGTAEEVDLHLVDCDARAGDVFLLCSDGLNDLVDDGDIELVVRALAANLPLAARILVQTAKDNGGYDNVSVVLAKIVEPGGVLRRLRRRFRRG